MCVTLAAAMVWLTAAAVPSLAYFNRGAVQISLSQTSMSLAQGSSASVSVTIDPIKEDQLPGCGMAECPQTCGSSGCLNENGECTCSGTTYKTYHSSVAVSSSNASVATASYANGTLTVKGVGAGTAVITATGSMRQYTDASVTMNVTVKGSESASANAAKPSSGNDGASAAPTSGMSASEIKGAGAAAAAQSPDSAAAPDGAEDSAAAAADQEEAAAASAAPLGELRNTKKGLYRIVELTDSTDAAACIAQAAEEKSHIVFQKKSGENVKWSWTFDAADLGSADVSSLKLDIKASAECPDSIKDFINVSGGNAYYMQFEHAGSLPAPAEIYINVSEVFPDSASLKLYHIAENGAEPEEVSKDIMAENGYATFTIESCSDYILTDGTVKANTAADGARAAGGASGSGAGAALPAALGAAAVIVIIAAAVVILRKKKHQ